MLTLTIVLRKEVETTEQAETLYELVRARMEDRPDVKVTGNVSNHFPHQEKP